VRDQAAGVFHQISQYPKRLGRQYNRLAFCDIGTSPETLIDVVKLKRGKLFHNRHPQVVLSFWRYCTAYTTTLRPLMRPNSIQDRTVTISQPKHHDNVTEFF
jgi:hypothetical protein